MGKDGIIKGVIRVDPSKSLYAGRISIDSEDGDCLGAIDPITLDKINLLKESEGKTIKFKPRLIERRYGMKTYVVNKFSIE